MNKYTLPFSNCPTVIPFVSIITNDGKSILALVDSGSESTLISKSFKKDFPGVIQSSSLLGKMNMIGFGGEKVIPLLEAQAKIPIITDKGDDKDLNIIGYVHDLSSFTNLVSRNTDKEYKVSMLIGSDTLKALNASINYKRNEISFCIK